VTQRHDPDRYAPDGSAVVTDMGVHDVETGVGVSVALCAAVHNVGGCQRGCRCVGGGGAKMARARIPTCSSSRPSARAGGHRRGVTHSRLLAASRTRRAPCTTVLCGVEVATPRAAARVGAVGRQSPPPVHPLPLAYGAAAAAADAASRLTLAVRAAHHRCFALHGRMLALSRGGGDCFRSTSSSSPLPSPHGRYWRGKWRPPGMAALPGCPFLPTTLVCCAVAMSATREPRMCVVGRGLRLTLYSTGGRSRRVEEAGARLLGTLRRLTGTHGQISRLCVALDGRWRSIWCVLPSKFTLGGVRCTRSPLRSSARRLIPSPQPPLTPPHRGERSSPPPSSPFLR